MDQNVSLATTAPAPSAPVSAPPTPGPRRRGPNRPKPDTIVQTDPEIGALNTILVALNPLSPDACDRVMGYVGYRIAEKRQEAERSAAPVRTEPKPDLGPAGATDANPFGFPAAQ